MPYPRNVETARAVEAEVRANGATPATIAIMDGAFRIGLTDDQLEELGQRGDVLKPSLFAPYGTERSSRALHTTHTTNPVNQTRRS